MRLRAYQHDAVLAGRLALDSYRSAMIVLPTGAGKCVTPDTWTWSEGLRRFGDCWGRNRIATPWSPRKVEAWYDDGECDGFKVTLDCGWTIDGTPSHRVLVRRHDGKEEWCKIGELYTGDHVAVARGQADFGNGSLRNGEAYTLGLLVADGCLINTRGTQRLQVDKQLPVMQAIAPVLEYWRLDAGGRRDGEVRVKEVNVYHASAAIHGPLLGRYLGDRFGLTLGDSERRSVPNAILEADESTVADFLKGYFDGDGYCAPVLEVSTASRTLAEQVGQLLLGLGVFCSIRTKATVGQDAHIVSILDVDAFGRKVGGLTNYGLRKDISYRKLMAKKRNTNVDTVPGVGGILKAAAADVASKHRRTDAWRYADAYYSGEKKPSYATLREFAMGLPLTSPHRAELQRIIDEHRAWSPVDTVKPSTQRRIDCQVADAHSFVGNGIANHNTIVFATMANDWPQGRVLILAHTEELINQAAEKVAKITKVQPCVEQAGRKALPVEWGGSKIVVGSVATVYREDRLNNSVFGDPAAFGLIIVDECHHATRGNRMYSTILDHYPNAKVLGVTATVDRTDGQRLDYFETLAYELKLSTAINNGYLVPVRQEYGICTSLDFSRVRVRGGDFVDADQEALMTEEAPLHEVAGAILDKCGDVPTLVFASGIHHAERLTEILKERHQVRAVCVHGGNKDYPCPSEWRRRRLAECARGEHQILVGCDVFYEGFDLPIIGNVVIAKKTKSRLRYAQAVGRGIRIHPSVDLDESSAEIRKQQIADSPKPYMTVIDLVGASTELELELPCVADLLTDGTASGEARRRAKKKAIDEGGSLDMAKAVASEEEQLRREEEHRRREEADKAKRAALIAETKHEWVAVPALGGEKPAVAVNAPVPTQPMATDAQIARLAKYGINARGMTKRQASGAIGKLGDSPTKGQRKALEKHGLTARNIDHASFLLDLTKIRGYSPPDYPLTKDVLKIRWCGEGEYRPMVVEPDGAKLIIPRSFKTQDDVRQWLTKVVDPSPETAVA